MNPIQQALATADKVIDAQNALEQASRDHIIPTVTGETSALAFLKWAVKRIGGGFHPDTRGDDYLALAPDGGVVGPTFNESEAIYFDNQIEQVFRFLPDPYAVTLDLVHADEEARVNRVTAHECFDCGGPLNKYAGLSCRATYLHKEEAPNTDPQDRVALVFTIDVTNLTPEQRGHIEAAVSAQLDDGTEDYPAVTYESGTFDHDDERDIISAVQVGLGF